MATVSVYYPLGLTQGTSYEYDSLDGVLLGLLDNNSGLIKAEDIRNSVYTLWERVDSVVSASISVTAAVAYISSTPSTNQIDVGGIKTGSTFSGTISDVLDRIFYPYVTPTPSISPIGSGILEFGSSTSITLNYSVSLGTKSLTPLSLVVDGTSKTFPPYSGAHSTTGTFSVSTITASESNVFVISCNDGVNTVTGTQTLYWMNKIYWGRVNLTSIGNPNLTLNPGSSSVVASICTDSVIRNLNGAGANGVMVGSQFSVVKEKYYEGIDGSGNYLIFAWPSTLPNANSPIFRVNGSINTAFTNVRTSSPLVNSQGYSGTDYEVWVSNTRYFSPVDIEIS
jgi:hypothetical protein